MLTRKHIVRYQWSEKAVSVFSISCMEIESIVEFSTINVLQFSRIREYFHMTSKFIKQKLKCL